MSLTKGFDKKYWTENYSEPTSMDGIGNAKDHARYIKAFFQLEMVDISSVVDLGFGYGYLFQKVLKEFIPYKAMGIEPSRYAFDRASKRKLKPVESTNLTLLNEDLMSWCKRKSSSKLSFDLGICTSVFQYIENKELEITIEILSKRIKFLYLSVPTDFELKRQVEDIGFDDKYAIKRSRAYYRKALSKHFTNISSRIWESKEFFSEETTQFTDLLYRS